MADGATTTTATTDTTAQGTAAALLAKGTLVVVEGLESKAGKNLNGGLGILLNAASSIDNVLRYPVRIFALLEDDNSSSSSRTILETVMDKKLKTTNVTRCPNPETNTVFQQAAYQHMEEAQKSDMTKLLYWLETYCHVRPQAFYMGFSYANALREVEQKYPESAQLLWDLHQQHTVKDDPRYPTFYRETVLSYCAAQVHFEDALQYALQIPLDTPDNLSLAKESLTEVCRTCKSVLTHHKGIGTLAEEMATLHLEAAQARWALDPTDAVYLEYLGGAYCWAGQHYEGAKYYRRALAQGAPRDGPHIKTGLILAQLQCPGMPLADYHVLQVNGSALTCVRNSDKHKLQVNTDTGEVTATDELEAISYSMPDDPNDPDTFANLVAQLEADTDAGTSVDTMEG